MEVLVVTDASTVNKSASPPSNTQKDKSIKRSTIVRDGEAYILAEPTNGVWTCPFCEEGKVLFITEDQAREHIHNEHVKKQLKYKDWVIYRCTQSCGVLRERSHYHCPTCDKAIISRGDFIFHLKGHEAKQGLKPTRGRKKTLATVMGNEAGLQNIQLFSHASLIVSPTILSLIDDQQQFWAEVEMKCGMTCLRDGDAGQQFCVLQGQYDSVIKANSYLEQYVLDKLNSEVSAKLITTAATTSSLNTEADNSDQKSTSVSPQPPEGSADGSAAVRKSGRKRKPNSTLEEYITPKSSKVDEPDAMANSAAIRQSSVAQTLKTSVEQECHVTLSKNIDSGEYQVHMMFPPPIISEPPPDDDQTDGVHMSITAQDTVQEGREDQLADVDDDDADEDYKVDHEVENAVSEDHMDDDADVIDDTLKRASNFSRRATVMFRCDVCNREFTAINDLLKHKTHSHSSTNTSSGSSISNMTTSTPHYCKECPFSTPLKQTLKLHIAREHREKQLECLDCHEMFGPLIDLKNHIRETGHRNGQHTNLFKQMVECKICKKTIQLKNLKSHVELIHEKQKNFSCELCGKMFGKRCLVKEHMESHKNMAERKRPWVCAICGQGFFKKLPLDEHMSKHVGQPQYQCDICPKKFYHQSGWKRHIQHHGEARPFSCSVCNKSFKTSTNLSAHKMVHTPMAFMCLCGKSYQQKTSLKSHQDKCAMHQDIIATQMAEEQYQTAQKYMCGFCQMTFLDFGEVEEHVKQHVAQTVEGDGLESTLSIPEQQTDQQDIIDGSGLDHLAMTAALEQQNMVSGSSEGRALIVTDINGGQVQQLVVYQDGTLMEGDASHIDPNQISSGQIVSEADAQLEILEASGRQMETTETDNQVESELQVEDSGDNLVTQDTDTVTDSMMANHEHTTAVDT